METLIFIFKTTILVFLTAMEFAMTLRAIMGWFVMEEDSKFLSFLVEITEPIVYPVRVICDKFNWFTNIPLDIPYFIAFMLLSVINMILSFF